MIKVIVTSDLHGYLPKIKEKFDLLLICGDIVPVWNCGSRQEWFEDDFMAWVKSLPFNDDSSKVIMIPGNHDRFMEAALINHPELLRIFEEVSGNRLKILINEKTEFTKDDRAITIFGSPYCKMFYNWAFMPGDEHLEELYDKIPNDLDILITHDAPDLNNLGLISEGRNYGVNAGNRMLAEAVKRRSIKYHFCGHIHSGNHRFEDNGFGTKSANVSYVDEQYNPTNEPLTFEL